MADVFEETVIAIFRSSVKFTAYFSSAVDVNMATDNSLSLIESVLQGNSEQVAAVIRAGANVNALDKDGNTTLICAAIRGNNNCVQLLLAAGADVNLQGKDRDTPLMKAAYYGHEKCVELLTKAGANVNVQIPKVELQ